jgi:hypothetical protein
MTMVMMILILTLEVKMRLLVFFPHEIDDDASNNDGNNTRHRSEYFSLDSNDRIDDYA